MIRGLLIIGLFALVAYLAVLALLFVMQRSLLFPGTGQSATVAEAGLVGFEDVVLATSDGESLAAWWRAPEPGRAVIVYFHGNGGSLWDRRFRAAALARQGRGLLLVSYRGYAGSTGHASEAGLRIDARAAYDWVARSYEPARMVAYGESLGTGVVVRLATERAVAGVILDAPYTSIADVASAIYWFAPVGLLMRDPFRSLEIIHQIEAPLLVLHGDRDEVIPFTLGERLYAAAPEPKHFVRLPGVGHSTVLESGGLEHVDAFLTRIENSMSEPSSSATTTSSPRPVVQP
jgi:fermentation-respiration switch protein FrsA (DUF1100 family)